MSDKICVLPWTHFASNPDGTVMPCCLHWPHQNFAGNIKEQDFKEIFNSDVFKKIRLEMLEGKEPKECEKCFRREKLVGHSLRKKYNTHPAMQDTLSKIKDITNKDGTINEIKIKYWDVRFSNLCNMACIMCGPPFSSKWAQEMGMTTDQGKVLKNFDQDKTYQFINDYVQDVEAIYFAGGEPLIMDEHYYILDKLFELGKTDIDIRYNTNMLKTTHKGKDVFEYWKNWKGPLEVSPSIDAIGAKAEYIRYGTVWNKIDENLTRLVDLGIKCEPLVTIGIHNLFHLPELVKYFDSKGITNFGFNMIDAPGFNILYAPQSFKDDALVLYNNFMNQLSGTAKERAISISNEIFTRLNTKTTQMMEMESKFIKTIKKIDKNRNLDFFKTFPELEKYFGDYYYEH